MSPRDIVRLYSGYHTALRPPIKGGLLTVSPKSTFYATPSKELATTIGGPNYITMDVPVSKFRGVPEFGGDIEKGLKNIHEPQVSLSPGTYPVDEHLTPEALIKLKQWGKLGLAGGGGAVGLMGGPWLNSANAGETVEEAALQDAYNPVESLAGGVKGLAIDPLIEFLMYLTRSKGGSK